ncbi:hypothetical protein BJX99DRAFT_258858 [Aspergillus californicus]
MEEKHFPTLIYEEVEPNKWVPLPTGNGDLDVLELHPDSNFVILVDADLFGSRDKILSRFPEAFQRVVTSDVGGSFHCHYTCTGSKTLPNVSWASFKLKCVHSLTRYLWHQPTLFVETSPTSDRQIIWIIDLNQRFLLLFMDYIPHRGGEDRNLFLWHRAFAQGMVNEWETMWWMLRDLARNIEKLEFTGLPDPAIFRDMRDMVRHTIHINECLESAEHTIQCIIDEHTYWRTEDPTTVAGIRELWLDTQSQLLSTLRMIHSLKSRGKALQARLHNQIDLAYNLVSQGFGRNARSDSATMKALGVVGLVYLPGTFVSGIFGTNFFNFERGSNGSSDDWVVSSNFWLFWAVTVSLTMATILAWGLWHFRVLLISYWRRLMRAKNVQCFETAVRGSRKVENVEAVGITTV